MVKNDKKQLIQLNTLSYDVIVLATIDDTWVQKTYQHGFGVVRQNGTEIWICALQHCCCIAFQTKSMLLVTSTSRHSFAV